MKILIVNSLDEKCGVHQYGLNLFQCLSENYEDLFAHEKFGDAESLISNLKGYTHVIYNWHPATIPFLSQHTISVINSLGLKQIIIDGHDHLCKFQGVSIINCDSTAENGIPRPLLNFKSQEPISELTVGSFGFAFDFKNFDIIPNLVARELPSAKLRMHLTPHSSGDTKGRISSLVQSSCDKLGIDCEISQDFLSSEDLVCFLSKNSINVFLYPWAEGRGLSSSIDFAFAANRPVALSDSHMFRHVAYEKKFFLSNFSLGDILSFGTKHIQPFKSAWNAESIFKIIQSNL